MTTTQLGEAVLKLTTDTTGFNTGLKQAREESSKLADGLKKLVGAYLGLEGVKRIVEFFKSSIVAWEEEELAITKLNAVLKSTGGIAGVTANDARDLAEALSQVTTYGHETILSAEDLLLTFTNIGKDIFPQATETVLNMSTALGQDLKASAIQLGKALQDPILGVTALRRVGVNFNEAQTEVIKNLVETGRSAEAQAAILKELQTEFGGVARAAGDTATGALKKMNNAFGDLKAQIGRATVEQMQPLVSWLTRVSENLTAIQKASNDLREALKAQEKGIADTNAKLVIAQAHYKNVNFELHNWTDALWLSVNAQQVDILMKIAGAKSIDEYVARLREQSTAAQKAMQDVEALAEREAQAAKKKAEAAARAAKAAEKAAKYAADQQKMVDDLLKQTDLIIAGMEAIEKARTEAAGKAEAEHQRFIADANEAMANTEKYAQIVIDGEKKKEEARKEEHEKELARQKELQDFVINTSKSMFEELGNDIASGELSWKSLGEAALHVIGRIISALGDQLAADAAADLIRAFAASASIIFAWMAPGFFSSALIKGAGAAAAWVTGAALSATSFSEGADFTVPPGFSNDSFPMFVESGEHVKVTPAGSSKAGGSVTQNISFGNITSDIDLDFATARMARRLQSALRSM